jgi:hypothetical protein
MLSTLARQLGDHQVKSGWQINLRFPVEIGFGRKYIQSAADNVIRISPVSQVDLRIWEAIAHKHRYIIQ